MNLKDLIITANGNLFRNKLRTLLTVLAIFVGAFTLTLTNGLGDGVKDYIETQVKNFEGSGSLFINKKPPKDDSPPTGEPREYAEPKAEPGGFDPNGITVTPEQIEQLANEFPEVVAFSPKYSARAAWISLDGDKKYVSPINSTAVGVTQKLEAGGQIDGDNQIILRYSLAKFFSEDFQSLIGREVTIGYKVGVPPQMQTMKLKVVGVATKGIMDSYFSTIDRATEKQIYEAQRSGGEDYNRFATFSFQLAKTDAATVAAVKKKLNEKGFEVETMADQNKRLYDAIGIFQIGMNLFAGIALLAASFGIINTLVIAVLERTKEIGLQKALGMGRGKVFLMFSLESILIGFWGAILGIVSAIVTGSIANSYAARFFNESFEGYRLVAFKPLSLLLIILTICFIAFLAGVLPAFRASRLNPIEALRYE